MTKRLTIALIALVALVLVAVLPVSATYYSVNNTLQQAGAVVYIGEQQLNVAAALSSAGTADSIGWWASAATITSTSPTVSYPLSSINSGNYYIAPSAYANYLGNWYAVKGGNAVIGTGSVPVVVFNVQDPSLAVDVWDINTSTTVTSGTVIQGDWVTFRVNTNLQSALDPAYRGTDSNQKMIGSTLAGNMDIKVKPASGNTYAALYVNKSVTDKVFNTSSIQFQAVNQSLWFWGTKGAAVPADSNIQFAWATGATDSTGQNAYPAGVYTVTAQSDLNGMYDNYLNGGASYTGKTVSQPATVTIASNTVSISANVDSVVRSKPFSVTITGKPGATYHLWVKGVSSLDGTYDNQPPIITANQVGVVQDPTTYQYVADTVPPTNPIVDNGNYPYQNGVPIIQDVATGSVAIDTNTQSPTYGQLIGTGIALGNGTYEYANVTLDQTG